MTFKVGKDCRNLMMEADMREISYQESLTDLESLQA